MRARAARVLAGLAVTAAVLLPGRAAPDAEGPTFSREVVRIFQRHCQECHRPGDIAPFPLLRWEDAHRVRGKILRAVETGAMPPWKPVAGFGDLADPRRLSAEEVDTVARWVRAGAPPGDPADLPPPRAFPEGWVLGAPDTVVEAPAYTLTAGAGDVYRCFVVPTDFDEDRWVTAFEVRPGNRAVVHHVLTFLDTEGHAERLDAAEPGAGYTCFGGPGFPSRGGLGGWAPGSRPQALPEGVGMLLPRGARVVVQVHYHHRGAGAADDRTRVGLHFARGRIDKRLRVIPVLDRSFVLPAGAERHEVRATFTLPPSWRLHAIGVAPHMHLLGREITVTATLPDGTLRPLIRIDDWDFHWQGTYALREPVPLPGGTRLEVVGVFDNSARNPRNPNRPPRDVGWGEGTADEMLIAFVRVTVDAERLGHVPRVATGDR